MSANLQQIWRPYEDTTEIDQDHMAKLLTPANYKHLNLDTFKHATAKLRDPRKNFGSAIVAVTHLSGFTSEHDPFDFPFNNDGLPWIEKYLDTQVKPYITKWGRKDDDLRVLEADADPLAKHWDDAIGHVNTRFFIASCILGQCLAQQHGLFWTPDGPALMRDPAKPEDFIGISGEVRKYVRFGAEDSFLGYSKYIGNREFNNQLMQQAVANLKLDLPKTPIYQAWFRDDGLLDSVNVLHPKTRKLLTRIKIAIVNKGDAEIQL